MDGRTILSIEAEHVHLEKFRKEVPLSNGSRLSCGRNARGRDGARWVWVWKGTQTEFYLN